MPFITKALPVRLAAPKGDRGDREEEGILNGKGELTRREEGREVEF